MPRNAVCVPWFPRFLLARSHRTFSFGKEKGQGYKFLNECIKPSICTNTQPLRPLNLNEAPL
ncbi:hypothetical protein COU36_03995, partial [Candidatus Micrarchaeota archaeon CG10_big_fil_rev_8_21_14_0_10_59_7]